MTPASPPANAEPQTTAPNNDLEPQAGPELPGAGPAKAQGKSTAEPDKLVPVGESIRYRKRAQAAEQQLGELQERLTQLQSQLGASQDTITSLERRQKIDALLTNSDAIDLEAARLLTEISVSQMDEPDVHTAVDDLRHQKPYLFRHRVHPTDSAMGPRVVPGTQPPAAEQAAAERAVATGDRRDLLDYLRLRRK